MNEPEVPLHSVVSPYRRLARRAWLCRQECSTCDCSAQVAVALSQSRHTVQEVLQQPEILPEIQELIHRFQQQSGDIISEPGVCEHIEVIRLPRVPLRLDYWDEDL